MRNVQAQVLDSLQPLAFSSNPGCVSASNRVDHASIGSRTVEIDRFKAASFTPFLCPWDHFPIVARMRLEMRYTVL
jgi:hypothetical protein